MATRIGVDVGGTFTDLILYDEATRAIEISKVGTTPQNLEEGCMQAICSVADREKLARTNFFIHGTTTGLNALLERRGAQVGLLTTSGFRDILELRRGDRKEIYNIFWYPPYPLVRRRFRVPVQERIRADGTVERPLLEEDIAAAAVYFRRNDVTSIAVAFINSYANPAHELRAEELLRRHGFDGDISLSHKTAREYREYERTSTTVIDAFVKHGMATYLNRLETRLAEHGFHGECLVTRSGGGAMTFTEARERPFETIMSGPVGGIEAAVDWAAQLGLRHVITMDVGGTSFDTAVISDGRAPLLHEGNVVDMPLLTPWIDVRSIGAGGGSIAYVDQGGLLRVGPESSGASPGPACYGRGGTRPTVTDAAFLLGMLGRGELAAGLVLNQERAERAIAPLASRLNYSVVDCARGIISIAVVSMANAIREITIQRGQDPRKMTLMAFGGAGPLLATLLATDLGIRRIVVPPFPGNLSAWGLLCADVIRSSAQTRVMRLSAENAAEVDRILGGLFEEIERRRTSSVAQTRDEAALDLRYVGQEHYLTLGIELEGHRIAASAEQIHDRYQQTYLERYGGSMDAPVEIVTIRATRRIPLASRPRVNFVSDAAGDQFSTCLDAYSFQRDAFMRFRTAERDGLAPGKSIMAPLIVYDPTATIYVDHGWSIVGTVSGALVLQCDEPG